jgi:hypothetical protein
MHSRRVRLEGEQLGGRILPSATPLFFPAAIPTARHGAVVETLRPASIENLNGTLRGSLTPAVKSPVDAGLQYRLTGSGVLGSPRKFTATGFLRGTGFIAKGHATGELTLANAKGSITVKVVGPPQAGFAPLPGSFHFTVTAGTGAYKGLTGDGEVSLQTHGLGGPTTFRLVFA